MGVASTIAYVLLYLLLRGAMSAQAANVLSLLVTAVANTAANRRLTFGISGRQHAARHQVKRLIAFGIGLALTSGALAALNQAQRTPARSRAQDRPRPDSAAAGREAPPGSQAHGRARSRPSAARPFTTSPSRSVAPRRRSGRS